MLFSPPCFSGNPDLFRAEPETSPDTGPEKQGPARQRNRAALRSALSPSPRPIISPHRPDNRNPEDSDRLRSIFSLFRQYSPSTSLMSSKYRFFPESGVIPPTASMDPSRGRPNQPESDYLPSIRPITPYFSSWAICAMSHYISFATCQLTDYFLMSQNICRFLFDKVVAICYFPEKLMSFNI